VLETVPTPPTMPEAPAPARGSSESAEVVTEPHRLGRICGPPERYGYKVLLLHNDKPTTYKEAMMVLTPLKWLDAIKSMIESMYKNQVWNLVDTSEGVMFIKCSWICKETDMDVYLHKRFNLSKGVYDKVQKVDYNKIGSFSSDAGLYGLF
jgi:hypothetical protein